jgi:hypothetical protein
VPARPARTGNTSKKSAKVVAPERFIEKSYTPAEIVKPTSKFNSPRERRAPSSASTRVQVTPIVGDVAPHNAVETKKGYVAVVATPDGLIEVKGPTAKSVQDVVVAQEARVEALPGYSVNQGYSATGGKRRTKRIKKMRTKDTKRNFTR